MLLGTAMAGGSDWTIRGNAVVSTPDVWNLRVEPFLTGRGDEALKIRKGAA